MVETDYWDRMQNWIETAVYKTTGRINGSVELCKEDVRNRKTAIKVSGPYGNKGWPDGITFDDLDAFTEPETQEPTEPVKEWADWNSILDLVASEPDPWKKGIAAITTLTAAETNTGDLEIFQYLPVLIEKAFNFREGVHLAWKDAISKVVDSPDAWISGINAIFAMASDESNIGELEIFQWLPNLIEKIYEYQI
jgi:hypothetical protein